MNQFGTLKKPNDFRFCCKKFLLSPRLVDQKLFLLLELINFLISELGKCFKM